MSRKIPIQHIVDYPNNFSRNVRIALQQALDDLYEALPKILSPVHDDLVKGIISQYQQTYYIPSRNTIEGPKGVYSTITKEEREKNAKKR